MLWHQTWEPAHELTEPRQTMKSLTSFATPRPMHKNQSKENKQEARKKGIYYGVLDKGTRKRKLSSTQKKNNKKKSKIRAKVEHPFAFMKEKLNYKNTVAKTIERNDLRFTMNCILYNIFRADYLLSRQNWWGTCVKLSQKKL